MKFDLEPFKRVFVHHNGDKEWLVDPHEGPEYVRASASSETLILYASTSHGLLYSLLIPHEVQDALDKDSIFRDFIGSDGSWHINYSFDGENTSEAWIDEPVDKEYLAGSEKPVFHRNFDGVRQYQHRLELNQKLIHTLDLYWLDERSAYCKLDDQGDIVDVIKIWNLPCEEFGDHAKLVTAKRSIIDLYLGAAKMVYLQRFDFTRVIFGNFLGWHNQSRGENVSDKMAYNFGIQSNGSYSNGYYILKPIYDGSDVSRIIRSRWDNSEKQFTDFITLDWKNKQIAFCSCDPRKTSNYFEPENNKPFDVSPVFFRSEVLLRYKQNREKYTLGQRSISCRGGWYLKSYDLNEDGQVHAYLYDLGSGLIDRARR